MNSEYQQLLITREDIERSLDLIRPHLENPAEYLESSIQVMAEEQPNLHVFINTHRSSNDRRDSPAFCLAVTRVYDMFPVSERNRILTRRDIRAAELRMGTYEDSEGDYFLTDYYEELSREWPDFFQWWADTLNGLEDQETMIDFIIGTTLASMPYLLRSQKDDFKKLTEP